jgi:MFS family permease
MSIGTTAGGRSRSLILTAMIFAVAMTFIDQTIVSIAAPTVQRDLGLSASGIQWAINAYLLALAAVFAFGGRVADIAGPNGRWSSAARWRRSGSACGPGTRPTCTSAPRSHTS